MFASPVPVTSSMGTKHKKFYRTLYLPSILSTYRQHIENCSITVTSVVSSAITAKHRDSLTRCTIFLVLRAPAVSVISL